MTKRINKGIYQTADGKFEIERYPDGAWMLFKMVRGSREYINDFSTKRAAVLAAV